MSPTDLRGASATVPKLSRRDIQKGHTVPRQGREHILALYVHTESTEHGSPHMPHHATAVDHVEFDEESGVAYILADDTTLGRQVMEARVRKSGPGSTTRFLNFIRVTKKDDGSFDYEDIYPSGASAPGPPDKYPLGKRVPKSPYSVAQLEGPKKSCLKGSNPGPTKTKKTTFLAYNLDGETEILAVCGKDGSLYKRRGEGINRIAPKGNCCDFSDVERGPRSSDRKREVFRQKDPIIAWDIRIAEANALRLTMTTYATWLAKVIRDYPSVDFRSDDVLTMFRITRERWDEMMDKLSEEDMEMLRQAGY